ncbi:histidine kinase [Rhodanobacter sp. L36]|uniref:sensor histidine kinase n=1 Tax=Rhodanobacter sp. L36 TaxID=1747221 RepID=UPI00131CEE05|nr:histidine kinase [Rhodanobacter sp. L36]
MSAASTTHRFRNWSLVFGIWTLLVLSYSASSVISSINEGYPASWSRAFAWNFLDFYLWMLLTPLVSWLGRRGAHDWPRFWVVHIPAGIVIAGVQSAVMLTLYWQITGPSPIGKVHTFDDFLHQESVYKFHFALLIYWLLLVVLRGLASQRSLKDERLRSSQLEGQLAQSQLQALRMQLQPHFLFNTLNAISALALADPPQARLMISRLSDFLRLTLEERNAQQVSLSREMQFLDCYLGIQQVRFQDRLTTHLDIAADTLDAAVPNLILQPLVENALRHGLLAKSERGNLRISAHRAGDLLRLRVEDDGLGLPPAGHHEGIGLSNTRERLQALFGTSARLQLSRIDGGGTRVDLRFPFVACNG